jgi:hypothetical protein
VISLDEENRSMETFPYPAQTSLVIGIKDPEPKSQEDYHLGVFECRETDSGMRSLKCGSCTR